MVIDADVFDDGAIVKIHDAIIRLEHLHQSGDIEIVRYCGALMFNRLIADFKKSIIAEMKSRKLMQK